MSFCSHQGRYSKNRKLNEVILKIDISTVVEESTEAACGKMSEGDINPNSTGRGQR
jgi:hypothetical protein